MGVGFFGYRWCMVNPALLASIDALSVDEQIELVEHINDNLSAKTAVSDADKALIEARANDVDPSHWLSIREFDDRIRARFS